MGPESARRRIEGRSVLFGFDSTPAVLHIRARPTAWRASGAAAIMGGFTLLAAVVAIVPPHAPWLIGSLVGGAVLARRRWIEHYTLESVEGTCPKCEARLDVKSSRLRLPHPVPCDGCHHECALKIDPEVLEA